MCVAVSFDHVGPRQIPRSHAALGFAFTAKSMTAGAVQSRRGHVEIAEHGSNFFSGGALTAHVERLTAFLLWCQAGLFRRGSLLSHRRQKTTRKGEHECR